jgi:hypothetical protein
MTKNSSVSSVPYVSSVRLFSRSFNPNILRFCSQADQPIVFLPCHGMGSELTFSPYFHVPAIARIDRF